MSSSDTCRSEPRRHFTVGADRSETQTLTANANMTIIVITIIIKSGNILSDCDSDSQIKVVFDVSKQRRHVTRPRPIYLSLLQQKDLCPVLITFDFI